MTKNELCSVPPKSRISLLALKNPIVLIVYRKYIESMTISYDDDETNRNVLHNLKVFKDIHVFSFSMVNP